MPVLLTASLWIVVVVVAAASPHPRRVDVHIGKHEIPDTYGLAHHWALRVDGVWWEIEGASLDAVGAPNVIRAHANSSKYTSVEHSHSFSTCHGSAALRRLMGRFNDAWLRHHPTYSVFLENCQLYVKDFLWHVAGAKVVTQVELPSQYWSCACYAAVAYNVAVERNASAVAELAKCSSAPRLYEPHDRRKYLSPHSWFVCTWAKPWRNILGLPDPLGHGDTTCDCAGSGADGM